MIMVSPCDPNWSFPSVVDGLNSVHRKILFCAFRKLTEETMISSFSPYVSFRSAYYIDEKGFPARARESCIVWHIVSMVRDWVGTNNINLLLPQGLFGSRYRDLINVKSALDAYTVLSPITRYLFPKDDDIILDYLKREDGGRIFEPSKWYAPVIPMVLVNGSQATDSRTFVPNYNPKDIVANIRRMLNGEPPQPMDPWYRGFTGTIEKTTTNQAGASYTVSGVIEKVNETTLKITELPIGKWTQDYMKFLDSLKTGDDGERKEPFIQDYRHDWSTICFEVKMSEENLLLATKEGLIHKFELTTTISTSDMFLLDSEGGKKKYDSPEEIPEDFFRLRLGLYKKRQEVLLEKLRLDLQMFDNIVRYMEEDMDKRKSNAIKWIIGGHDRPLDLKEKGFMPFPKKFAEEIVLTALCNSLKAREIYVVYKGDNIGDGNYDYLLQIPLTPKRYKEAVESRKQVTEQVVELEKSTPKSLWIKDLDALSTQL